MVPKKIFILTNLRARTLNRAYLEQVANEINSKLPTEIVYTTSYNDSIKKAKQLSANSANIVAACGGDGTVNSVLQGISDQGTLGIIPAGTTNVIARELGISLNLSDACKNLLTGAIKKVDVGFCNGHKFLFVTGTGYDAQVASNVSPTLKQFLGKFAYYITSIKELITYKPPKLTFTFNDGQPPVTGEFAIIANMRRYGGDLFFAPQARYDDGILDLVVLKRFNPRTLLRLFNFARRLVAFPSEDAFQLRAKSFHLRADSDCPYQVDGEAYAGTKNFYFSVKKQKINLLIP